MGRDITESSTLPELVEYARGIVSKICRRFKLSGFAHQYGMGDYGDEDEANSAANEALARLDMSARPAGIPPHAFVSLRIGQAVFRAWRRGVIRRKRGSEAAALESEQEVIDAKPTYELLMDRIVLGAIADEVGEQSFADMLNFETGAPFIYLPNGVRVTCRPLGIRQNENARNRELIVRLRAHFGVAPPEPVPLAAVAAFAELTDEQWLRIEPLVRSAKVDRAFAAGLSVGARAHVNGVRWALFHDMPWISVPKEYGGSDNHKRYKKWKASGVWQAITKIADERGLIERAINGLASRCSPRGPKPVRKPTPPPHEHPRIGPEMEAIAMVAVAGEGKERLVARLLAAKSTCQHKRWTPGRVHLRVAAMREQLGLAPGELLAGDVAVRWGEMHFEVGAAAE